MTEYRDKEQSISQSAPIEGYKFVGTFKTYRYTSSDKAEYIAGELYLPIAVKRPRANAGTQDDDNLSLDLVFPFDCEVVLDYAYSLSPPTLELTVLRAQRDSDTSIVWEPFWKGKVRGFSIAGREATIKVPSIFSLLLQGEVPNVYYQAPCNHVLYDEYCAVSRAANTYEGDVLSVNSTQVTVDGLAAVTNELAAGELVNTRNGERRLILSNVGTLAEVAYPFVDLIVGDTVQLVRGCDHSFATCKAKFANGINFGGYPYIPADNPFEGEL